MPTSSTVFRILLACCFVASTYAAPRELNLGQDRVEAIREEVREVLHAQLGKKMKKVGLNLPLPRMVRNKESIELIFDEGTIDLSGLKVSGISVNGTIRFEDLRLDYGALGLRHFKLTSAPRVFPNLETSLENVNQYLEAQGFKDTFVRQASQGDGIVFGGRRPVRMLMMRTNPFVTIQGRFTVDGSLLGFEIDEVQVENTNGTVAGAIQRRIRSQASQSIDLTSLFEGFELSGIEVKHGMLRVMSGKKEFLAQNLAKSTKTLAG